MGNLVTKGRMLQHGTTVAEVASVRWTFADDKQVAWTGWLTLADNSQPVGSDRFTLQLEDGSTGTILLMAKALPGQPAPFCFAQPAPRCKPAR